MRGDRGGKFQRRGSIEQKYFGAAGWLARRRAMTQNGESTAQMECRSGFCYESHRNGECGCSFTREIGMRYRRFSLFLVCSILASYGGATSAKAEDGTGFVEMFQYLSHDRWYVSNGWANGDYQSCEWRENAIATSRNDLRLTLSDRGGKVRPLGCPEIRTKARLGYGLYEARIRIAAGSGLVTAFFTYVGPPTGSPEHDEIDFEFLGKDPHTVNINHFTNGKPYDGKVIQLGFDASQTFHNYGFEWTPDKIRWFVDGKVVSETPVGAKIPRNPGNLYFMLWSGSKVQDAWMGPFSYIAPVTADVEWAAYTPTDAPCRFPESIKCK
jgi:endo-1,3-1,4-beta-glycanase ExoK